MAFLVQAHFLAIALAGGVAAYAKVGEAVTDVEIGSLAGHAKVGALGRVGLAPNCNRTGFTNDMKTGRRCVGA
ncbi:hypothetical protein GR183_08335 [Stappia sp. GBMRC 2046]|uniref:Porin n=1 Tax=Stappia sediminis TaxID=2692190 RepID=A0A7X3LTQ8_9HYPH|nr:hypothetical protein [Stappia sediminis]MXN64913.1 hypothetical protein [Stappia sediminis]